MKHKTSASAERIQKLVRILREAGSRGLTTLEIHEKTGSMAPHSDVDDARTVNFDILCDYTGQTRTQSGGRRRIYRYWLAEFAPPAVVEKFAAREERKRARREGRQQPKYEAAPPISVPAPARPAVAPTTDAKGNALLWVPPPRGPHSEE